MMASEVQRKRQKEPTQVCGMRKEGTGRTGERAVHLVAALEETYLSTSQRCLLFTSLLPMFSL